MGGGFESPGRKSLFLSSKKYGRIIRKEIIFPGFTLLKKKKVTGTTHFTVTVIPCPLFSGSKPGFVLFFSAAATEIDRLRGTPSGLKQTLHG